MPKRQSITCPECGDRFGMGKPAQHHLRDAHGIEGMRNHLIANPHDRQAAASKTAKGSRGHKSLPPKFRPARRRNPEDFDLIDDADVL